MSPAQQEQADLYRAALTAIATTNDSGPWIEVYRAAGGGYEGLQAIAQFALDVVALPSPTPGPSAAKSR